MRAGKESHTNYGEKTLCILNEDENPPTISTRHVEANVNMGERKTKTIKTVVMIEYG
jgi:hypothetical protein